MDTNLAKKRRYHAEAQEIPNNGGLDTDSVRYQVLCCLHVTKGRHLEIRRYLNDITLYGNSEVVHGLALKSIYFEL